MNGWWPVGTSTLRVARAACRRCELSVEVDHLVRERGEHADADGADGVTDRDAAPPRVEPRILSIDAPVGEAGEHLHREGLVEFDHVEVVEPPRDHVDPPSVVIVRPTCRRAEVR